MKKIISFIICFMLVVTSFTSCNKITVKNADGKSEEINDLVDLDNVSSKEQKKSNLKQNSSKNNNADKKQSVVASNDNKVKSKKTKAASSGVKKANTATQNPSVTTEIKPNTNVKPSDASSPSIKNEAKVSTSHTAVEASQYYQYNTVSSSNEKKMYNILVNAVKDTKVIVDVESLKIDKERGLMILNKMLADNPQFFWVSKYTSVSYNSTTGKVRFFALYYTDGLVTDKVDNNLKLTVTANRNTISNQINQFNAKVKAIVSTISPSLSKLKKEKAIHDYLIKHLTYDEVSAEKNYYTGETLPRCFDAYGALVKNSAVCEGYSKAFQYLCYLVGINSTQVVGESMGVNHMWNTVNIDGAWYMVDVTWADGYDNGMVCYDYFNVTSEVISSDHTINNSELSVPSCTSTKNAFYNTFAARVTSLSAAPKNYKAAADNVIFSGEKYVYVYVKNIDGLTGNYITTHFINSSSDIQKYIRANKYGYTFAGSFYSMGDYIILPIK